MEIQVDINLTKCQKAAYEALHDDNITYLVLRYSRQIGKTEESMTINPTRRNENRIVSGEQKK